MLWSSVVQVTRNVVPVKIMGLGLLCVGLYKLQLKQWMLTVRSDYLQQDCGGTKPDIPQRSSILAKFPHEKSHLRKKLNDIKTKAIYFTLSQLPFNIIRPWWERRGISFKWEKEKKIAEYMVQDQKNTKNP